MIPYTWSLDADKSLVDFTSHMLVPGYVSPDRGTLGQQRPFLSPEQRELVIRDWVWRNCHWTGENNPPMDPKDEINGTAILGWFKSSHSKLFDYTMGCSTIANFTIALLAAQGIYARQIWASSATGDTDHTVEYWSPAKCGWVHSLAQLNAHFERDGQPLSYLEWSYIERASKDRSQFRFVSPCPEGGVPFKLLGGGLVNWRGFWSSAAVENGNALHVGQPHPNWSSLQVWSGDPSRLNNVVATVQNPTFQDLYPIMPT